MLELVVVVVAGLLVVDLYVLPQMNIPLVVLVWLGAAALINAKIFLKIFAKYEPEPETAEKEE